MKEICLLLKRLEANETGIIKYVFRHMCTFIDSTNMKL